MRGFSRFIVAAFFGLLAGGASVQGAGSPVPLLGTAEVQADSIYLSDLVPAKSLASLRDSARGILIGAAPKLGASRIFIGSDITELLRTHDSTGEFQIPARIVVHRAGRLITREEVAATIRAQLKQIGSASAADFGPEDVHLSAPMIVPEGDVRLEILRMDFDVALNTNRFLLVSRAERAGLPFLVTVRAHEASRNVGGSESFGASSATGVRSSAPETVGAAGVEASARMDLGDRRSSGCGIQAPGVVANRCGGDMLVQSGKPTRLHVFSGNMQMMLQVTPLEGGGLNQTVRVKLPHSATILQGRVVGPAQLEARF